MNVPIITKIIDTINEAKDVKTITFNYSEKFEPGQYFMIWIPGIDEIPMSVSFGQEDIKGITFKIIGNATKSLSKFKQGDKIGIRGPYGNGFNIKGKNLLFVGGGTGNAILAPAIEYAIKNNIPSNVVMGFKSKNEVFFEKRIRDSGVKLIISTDDGSKGYKGLASQLANNILKEEKVDAIFTCGPELMMKRILDYSKNISYQASLERYIKCSIGICGQCCIGRGLRVCVDGPVFNGKTLKNVKDFGVYKRDSAGKKIQF